MSYSQDPQRQSNGLQKLWEQLNKKILHLRTARVITIDPATRFSLDTQIEELEAERNKVEQEIEELNKALEQRHQETRYRTE